MEECTLQFMLAGLRWSASSVNPTPGTQPKMSDWCAVCYRPVPRPGYRTPWVGETSTGGGYTALSSMVPRREALYPGLPSSLSRGAGGRDRHV